MSRAAGNMAPVRDAVAGPATDVNCAMRRGTGTGFLAAMKPTDRARTTWRQAV